MNLDDVLAVLGWYFGHEAEVKVYLSKRAEAIHRTIEARQPNRAELRARLLARRSQQEANHAQTAR